MKTTTELIKEAGTADPEERIGAEYQRWRYVRKKLGLEIVLRKRGRKSTISTDPEEKESCRQAYSRKYYQEVTKPKLEELKRIKENERSTRFDARSSPFVVKGENGDYYRVRDDLMSGASLRVVVKSVLVK